MFKHILLATDGSGASARAAALAVSLARALGSRLTALYVVDPYPYMGIGDTNPMGMNAYLAAAHDHAAKAHADVSQLCTQGGEPVYLEALTAEHARAADAIVQTARDAGADLIVVGSHGRGGVSRMMMGSVAAKVVGQSRVPVVVARGEADHG